MLSNAFTIEQIHQVKMASPAKCFKIFATSHDVPCAASMASKAWKTNPGKCTSA